jgi:nicotinamidase-related amidase
MKRHPQILNRNQTALLIVDVQQKINAVMMHPDLVVDSIVKLIKACQILNVPIFITEQYPKGLGPTEPKILEALGGSTPIQKMTFSCCGVKDLLFQLQEKNIRQVMVTGIECHVCVQQTALDLLAENLHVHVPKDAVSSRKELDYQTALERMSKAGVVLTTVETALFELLEEAGTPEFKEVSKLIK